MKEKSSHGTAEVLCPFFRAHSPLEIGCEGITDSTVIKLIFSGKKERDLHESIFCAMHYRNCELYRAIMEKYEEDCA